MKQLFHKWNTNLGISADDFFPENDDATGSLNPGNSGS